MAVVRKVLSSSSGNWIPCCWFECERPGYELHKTIFHEHARTLTCDNPVSGHVNFVFCSEFHKQLYLHSHVEMGKLPPGYRIVR